MRRQLRCNEVFAMLTWGKAHFLFFHAVWPHFISETTSFFMHRRCSEINDPVGQKHSRLAGGCPKMLAFWGEDEVRNEWVFAKGGNEWYGATEDEERVAMLVVSSCSEHRFICRRQRGAPSQLTVVVTRTSNSVIRFHTVWNHDFTHITQLINGSRGAKNR